MSRLDAAFSAQQQPVGSIRGLVLDKDFDVPLPGAQVQNVETGQRVMTSDQGHFVFPQVPPGKYTLVFSKEGFVRQVRSDVVVSAGQLTDVNVALTGEFVEMEEFVVQDILVFGSGTEAALLELRIESPALMDSISADLISRAGASDAASALRLVSGASVQDGRTAVIRGLPDRYVSSQMNAVRLPSADEDKRAVELDQFPAQVIESIQVSKTFTPDQQGDASGGAVNVRLKGVPDETILQIKAQSSYHSQASGESDFLTYDGGGVDFWGKDDGRDIQLENLGRNWDGAVGVSEDDAPIDSKWSIAGGGSREVADGVRIGGFASFFHERDSSYYENGIDDRYVVEQPGAKMTPQTFQGTVSNGDFKTALYDTRQSTESVHWGGLGSVGLETEDHAIGLTYLYTRIAEDKVTLAEDTRGKEYFFPGYDPNNPKGTGNEPNNLNAAPYIRLETLDYTERTTSTLQLNGQHKLPFEGFDVADFVRFRQPELDWVVADSSATLDQPDKRQFGSRWLAPSFNRGVPPFVPPFTTPPTHLPYLPDQNINFGNLQRIWVDLEEDSEQYSLNLKMPFEQWAGHEGYLKTGLFNDQVDREFDQETFTNSGGLGEQFIGPWTSFWSKNFPKENHRIFASMEDVDYQGEMDLSAWYAMLDLPLAPNVNLIGGARFETTEIGITVLPEKNATWYPKGSPSPITLNPGDADVDFAQDDVLPSIGLIYEPTEEVTLRGSYSETVARQTFKELTPILQQEYLGGDIFIGNPDLGMGSLENYDLRVDYVPYQGSLLSVSWFDKRIDGPIEYVQRADPFNYTTAVNYPKGELSGFELEARQNLGRFWEGLSPFAVGANATFIESEVDLPADEIQAFSNLGFPMTSRDMTHAPEHLYNLFITYDQASTGTQVGLFYTVQGDTMVAGAAESKAGFFIPSVYATEYDTLNLSVTQRLGRHFKLHLLGKNLTNPEIETVYRSEHIDGDVVRESYRAGFEISLGISAEFSF